MKKFSIDLKASDKGERKKALKYLKSKGLKFGDCDRFKDSLYWKYISVSNGDFIYIKQSAMNPIILTLPLEWYKLVEIVEGENICKVAFDNMFGNFKSDLETLLEI